MHFEIDISGQDILNEDFALCVANSKDIIYGFKFEKEVLFILRDSFLHEKYRYSKTRMGFYKTRIYCLIIYYIFKKIINHYPSILVNGIDLMICNDLDSHQNDIKSNLNYLLSDKLKIVINTFQFSKLSVNSNAHRYAYVFRKDKKFVYSNLVRISIKEFEKYLIKK